MSYGPMAYGYALCVIYISVFDSSFRLIPHCSVIVLYCKGSESAFGQLGETDLTSEIE